MNVLGIGTGELLLILLIALLVMGPERLPELVRLWARFVRNTSRFIQAWQNFNAQLNAEISREINQQVTPTPKRASRVAAAAHAAEEEERTIAPPALQIPQIPPVPQLSVEGAVDLQPELVAEHAPPPSPGVARAEPAAADPLSAPRPG
ncbi:MAG: twin-arginine translocase TatA/TatE family subunit [Caldilineales bacterium]|nr:twin-arginine translocase TatA/TatE family subunit [Caldilineales bacterium]